jgi:hypothetical protein
MVDKNLPCFSDVDISMGNERLFVNLLLQRYHRPNLSDSGGVAVVGSLQNHEPSARLNVFVSPHIPPLSLRSAEMS